MPQDQRFSIGDVSRICNISKKALRHYDSMQLISSQRDTANNYRYYTMDNLLQVPILKFYRQMGFTLEEMVQFFGHVPYVYPSLKQSFANKMQELEEQCLALEQKQQSAEAWYELIVEAQQVIEHHINNVSVRYMKPEHFLYQQQAFDQDLKSAIINIDWTNYLEHSGNKICGPVILHFSSLQSRLKGTPQPMDILQKTVLPLNHEETLQMGGCAMISCYHIGPHESLSKTYEKIIQWAQETNYSLGQDCFERYVTDYWTTSNTKQFVTEVLVQVTKNSMQ